ncbi:hypothetical protein C8N32_102241 [Rhodovulum imhoffii]|uniref:PH (Pleckstrin Homology) domain-containing protein n=1 Tax=Rhodovulum imhoffii TaxID=365340 RepID=A0A2T5BVW0_9RHOB|nr:hypothetical protein [Rhodovulum imhoffii]MBK5933187.1 hypothetical protein [Rhodovulum imhoffii]PTN03712.1 hypothetical protein C8N32_102241 [Rhodovulum imhoffii]
MPGNIAHLRVSAPRRFFGLGVLLLLAGVVLYIAMARPPEALGWRAFLLGLGVVVLVLGVKMHRATKRSLTLTEEGLSDSDGRILARLEEIEAVDRGLFAFKPSNGFVLKLKQPQGIVWAPGLWWRLGRRVGVGGVTSAVQAKVMAEALETALAERAAAR